MESSLIKERLPEMQRTMLSKWLPSEKAIVVIEGDSRMTIIKARRGITDKSVIGIFTEDIRVMSLNFISVLFQHADRDSNTVAHTIAKNGFKLGNSHFWVEDVPHEAAKLRWLKMT
ncbi:hypothetical protein Goarm_003113, partial [Gossypium armourianum]|nr:hypothetical protein [Gossypium armourianum]